jgi:hypothetical protein
VTNNYQEQLMHRKTRTMEQILDGLVRGNMRRVEDAAEHMQTIKPPQKSSHCSWSGRASTATH